MAYIQNFDSLGIEWHDLLRGNERALRIGIGPAPVASSIGIAIFVHLSGTLHAGMLSLDPGISSIERAFSVKLTHRHLGGGEWSWAPRARRLAISRGEYEFISDALGEYAGRHDHVRLAMLRAACAMAENNVRLAYAMADALVAFGFTSLGEHLPLDDARCTLEYLRGLRESHETNVAAGDRARIRQAKAQEQRTQQAAPESSETRACAPSVQYTTSFHVTIEASSEAESERIKTALLRAFRGATDEPKPEAGA